MMIDILITLLFIAVLGVVGFLTYTFAFKPAPVEEAKETSESTATTTKSSRAAKGDARKRAKTATNESVYSIISYINIYISD